MYFLITPRRRLGIAISNQDLKMILPVRGDIHFTELEDKQFGRTTISAWVFNPSSGPDILPRLLDARVTGMAQQGMNISGIEQIGDVFYAQSWWCRLE